VEQFWFKTVDSTQLEAKRMLEKVQMPFLINAEHQTAGRGSRNNQWTSIDGNLYFSFAIEKQTLPQDLPLASVSIYIGMLMKEVLSHFGIEVHLKWPNDLYYEEKKVGGILTEVKGNALICGIGFNLVSDEVYSGLGIKMDKKKLLESFIEALELFPNWKVIFRKFQLEFDYSRQFFAHVGGAKVSLIDAILNRDGSLTINGEKVYSLR